MNLHLAQFSVGRERSHIHRLHLRNVIFLYSPMFYRQYMSNTTKTTKYMIDNLKKHDILIVRNMELLLKG